MSSQSSYLAGKARLLGCLLLGCLVVLTACTTTETDPTRVSTSDVLFGKGRLNEHLAARKAYLAGLGQRLTQVDDELLNVRARLFSHQKELEQASIPQRELDALLAEIAQQEAQADALSNSIFVAQERIADLELRVATQQQTDLLTQQELADAKREVERLEQQLQVVTSGIKRALQLRAEQILSESP